MFVTVDRAARLVKVRGLTPNEACWLGYHFVKREPDLAKEWYVIVEDLEDSYPGEIESYCLDTNWAEVAYAIIKIIKSPPQPLHDCPKCDCKPGCCK